MARPIKSSYDPMILLDRIDGGATSQNWAGYAVTGATGSVTDVRGSWIVPAVTCVAPRRGGGSGNQYSAFWVGMDGFDNHTVEEIGTESDCVGGTPSTPYAWVQFYPNPPMTINTVTISPGDRIFAQVSYDTTNSKFTFHIKNETNGDSFSVTMADSSPKAQRDSAEWITEDPSIQGSLQNLANFNVVDYGEQYTSVSSTCFATIVISGTPTTEAIGDFRGLAGVTVVQITMSQVSGVVKAQPSVITTRTEASEGSFYNLLQSSAP